MTKRLIPLPVGMLLHCDISQSLLASCGSGLIVLLPQAAPLCPLLRQLFAPATHPSNLKLPEMTSPLLLQGGSLIPWTLARCLQRGWGHGDITGDTGTSLGTQGHHWDIAAPLCKEQLTGAEPPQPCTAKGPTEPHPKIVILKHKSRFQSIHFPCAASCIP